MISACMVCFSTIHESRSISIRGGCSADERPKEAWSENVKIVNIRTSRSDYTKFDAIAEQASRNISSEEEVLLDYEETLNSNRFINDKNEMLLLSSFSK